MSEVPSKRYIGRHVVITGAAGGIGSAICRRFADEGANVTGLDVSKPTYGALNFDCDLTDKQSVAIAIDQSQQRFGPAFAVIHAAAISENATVLQSSAESFNRIFDCNVASIVRLVQGFAPRMQGAKAGSFLFLSSINGQMGCPDLAAYATSKGAIDALTKTLAQELARDNIRVNAISPASIDTALLKNKFEADDDPVARLEENKRRHPIERLGQPEEVAAFAAFLCSDEAQWITGAIHPIDGGAHLARR